MALKYFNKGFNYSQDGPGNRLVYHLAGCNMTCPWCANPEGMDVCGNYKSIEIGDLVNEAVSSAPVLIDDGGVTFSGGEPTLQFEELSFALNQLKKEGFHTAIETNATNPRLFELTSCLDLLIADFKHPISSEHKIFTGLGNENILENLRKLSHTGVIMWIRTPLVHGVNDSRKCLEGFIREYSSGFLLDNVSFELLSYHEYGVQKWDAAGRQYMIKDGHVSKETIAMFEEAYQKAGLRIIHT